MKQPSFFECALVTGGKSGLGKGLSDFLEAKGIRVIAVSSTDFDLRSDEDVENLLSLISKEVPDLIINNAGLGFYGPAIDQPINDQMSILDVNIRALTKITLHAAAMLRTRGKKGTILNISSAAGFIPFPTFSVYAASKSFVNQFSLGLDQELKEHGIRVLCACPGQIATDFRNRSGKGHPQKPDRRALSIQEAVTYLWNQIETGRSLSIFDWRTQLLVYLSKCLPTNTLGNFLKRAISDRYSNNIYFYNLIYPQ